MADYTPLKEHINGEVVALYAAGLADVPGFDGAAFSRAANAGLDALELKERVRHIAAELLRHCGGDYLRAADGFDAMLDAATPTDTPSFAFAHWPMAQLVEDHGVGHFERSVALMHRITAHFSCEFAVRPFLIRYPERMLSVMEAWSKDASVHVRRNASEGVRPRLPWGQRLDAFVADPTPLYPILDRLRDDPELYVRRSVANCLNDIAKDHPSLLMDWLERWDEAPSTDSAWVKERALRTLVKAGDARALSLVGFGHPKVVVDGLTLDADAYALGDTLTFRFEVVSTSDAPQDLLIDYRVHYVKANGSRSPKVFKLTKCTLAPGERRTFERRQHLRPISTRRYHAGEHALDVQINGVVFGDVRFGFAL